MFLSVEGVAPCDEGVFPCVEGFSGSVTLEGIVGVTFEGFVDVSSGGKYVFPGVEDVVLEMNRF